MGSLHDALRDSQADMCARARTASQGVTLIVTPQAQAVRAGRSRLAASEEAASAALNPMAPPTIEQDTASCTAKAVYLCAHSIRYVIIKRRIKVRSYLVGMGAIIWLCCIICSIIICIMSIRFSIISWRFIISPDVMPPFLPSIILPPP
jgi:hypothetical protein